MENVRREKLHTLIEWHDLLSLFELCVSLTSWHWRHSKTTLVNTHTTS